MKKGEALAGYSCQYIGYNGSFLDRTLDQSFLTESALSAIEPLKPAPLHNKIASYSSYLELVL